MIVLWLSHCQVDISNYKILQSPFHQTCFVAKNPFQVQLLPLRHRPLPGVRGQKERGIEEKEHGHQEQ